MANSWLAGVVCVAAAGCAHEQHRPAAETDCALPRPVATQGASVSEKPATTMARALQLVAGEAPRSLVTGAVVWLDRDAWHVSLCPNAASGRELVGPWLVAAASGEVRPGSGPVTPAAHGQPIARVAEVLHKGLSMLESEDEAQVIARVHFSDGEWSFYLAPRRLSTGGDTGVRLSEPSLEQIGPIDYGQ